MCVELDLDLCALPLWGADLAVARSYVWIVRGYRYGTSADGRDMRERTSYTSRELQPEKGIRQKSRGSHTEVRTRRNGVFWLLLFSCRVKRHASIKPCDKSLTLTHSLAISVLHQKHLCPAQCAKERHAHARCRTGHGAARVATTVA